MRRVHDAQCSKHIPHLRQNHTFLCILPMAPFAACSPCPVHHQTAVDAPPVKVFDRTPNLAGAQIISYRVSGDGKWCVLIGITPGLPER